MTDQSWGSRLVERRAAIREIGSGSPVQTGNFPSSHRTTLRVSNRLTEVMAVIQRSVATASLFVAFTVIPRWTPEKRPTKAEPGTEYLYRSGAG